jgi:hypothetical protein
MVAVTDAVGPALEFSVTVVEAASVKALDDESVVVPYVKLVSFAPFVQLYVPGGSVTLHMLELYTAPDGT